MPITSTTSAHKEEPVASGDGVAAGSAQDFAELEFAPLTPNEVANMRDRAYLIGVHADRHRYLP